MNRGTVESCERISIANLKKWGYLEPGSKHGRFRWQNSLTGEITTVEVTVNTGGKAFGFEHQRGCSGEMILDGYVANNLMTTPCTYGGVRYWFKCGCGRNVVILYRPLGAYSFSCRHCHKLSYASRNVSRPDRDGSVLGNKIFRLCYGEHSVEKAQDLLETGMPMETVLKTLEKERIK